jgi:hypothetical protein
MSAMAEKVLMRRFVTQQLSYIRKVASETIKNSQEGVTDFVECMNFWIDIIQPIIKEYPKGISLLDVRWGALLYKELILAGDSAIFGAYLDSIRTLRAIFEMLVQTYVLEVECQIPREQDRFSYILSELVNLDDKGETFKVKMIDRMLGFSDVERKNLKKLYHELSMYAHPSATQLDLESATEPPIGYNGSDFQLCIKLMLEVTDLMVAIAIELRPEIAKSLADWLDRTQSWQQMSTWTMSMTLGRCNTYHSVQSCELLAMH